MPHLHPVEHPFWGQTPGMSRISHRRWAWIFIVCLIPLAIGTSVCAWLHVVLDQMREPKDVNTQAINQLLHLAQTQPIGAFPQNTHNPALDGARIPAYLTGDQGCWTFLQDAVAANADQYTLVAYDNGNLPHSPDVDDSIVQVDFADGRRVRMVFYQEALVGCSDKSMNASSK
jgi:hypothetical protein